MKDKNIERVKKARKLLIEVWEDDCRNLEYPDGLVHDIEGLEFVLKEDGNHDIEEYDFSKTWKEGGEEE